MTTVLIESREKNHLHEIRSKLNVESSDIGSCRERNRGRKCTGWMTMWSLQSNSLKTCLTTLTALR